MSFTYIPQREKWRTSMLLSWKKGDLRRFGEYVGGRGHPPVPHITSTSPSTCIPAPTTTNNTCRSDRDAQHHRVCCAGLASKPGSQALD
jgi:hypothetical protein